MEENRKKDLDPDAFWDLSDLVPKRKTSPRPLRESHSTEAVEVGVPARPASAEPVFGDVPLTERPVSPVPPPKAEKPALVYRPEGMLVREVRIYPWKSEYSYYEQFRRHAEQLAGREGKECPPVDFFSYMPQYTQLNREQLAYYLWWRTNFHRGTCLPAAYSYLLLYLYELINLDECHQNPQTGCQNMVNLWLFYRDRYPRLDALIREWLCDYCLLYQLPPPRLDPALYRTLLSGCRLKEFYIAAGENRTALSTALLLFCNNYDYTKSKFYREDTKDDYDRVLGGAIGETVDFLRESSGDQLTDTTGVSTVSRDIFAGAVCSWRLKRRIEVDYTSFSHTHDLRYIMTDVLKYAENALRAHRGIKSRLSIYAVSVPLRRRLDAYLQRALPPRQSRAAQKAEIPDYERRYDLPVTEVSFENAAEIEAASWQTTKRLVEAFSTPADGAFTPETVRKNGDFGENPPCGTQEPYTLAASPAEDLAQAVQPAPLTPPAAPTFGGLRPAFGGPSTPPPQGAAAAEGLVPPTALSGTDAFPPPAPVAASASPADDAFTPRTVRENRDFAQNVTQSSPFAAALGPLAAFIPLARRGDRAAQRDFARENGLMVDAVAEKINTVAGDILGDVILEDAGGAYTVIEDYLDFLTEQGVL